MTTMTEKQVKTAIEHKAFETIVKANAILTSSGKNVLENIDITYSNRRAKIAGKAKRKKVVVGYITVEKFILVFNLPIAMLNFEDFQNDTVIHEVAHLMAFRLGDSGHGYIRKSCCRKLGIVPSRCCKMKVDGYQNYTCKCGTIHPITERMAKKVDANPHQYSCRKCRSPLSRMVEVLSKAS